MYKTAITPHVMNSLFPIQNQLFQNMSLGETILEPIKIQKLISWKYVNDIVK